MTDFTSRLGLHISIHIAQFDHEFILKAKITFSSGYESAWVNGFSILLFIEREYLSSTPCDVKVQSVIQSESSVGTQWRASVAPNPKGLHVCVVFVQRHPAASGNSQTPFCSFVETSVLYDQVSRASFIKLGNASLLFALHFFFLLMEGNIQLGRHKALHILRRWKGGKGRYREWEEQRKKELGKRNMEKQGERMMEWEEKEGKRQRQEKGGKCWASNSSSPPSVSPQREKTTFCQVVSHHLFNFCWSYFIFIKNNLEEVPSVPGLPAL